MTTRSGLVVLAGSGVGFVGNYAFSVVAGRTLTAADFGALTALLALGMCVLLPVSGQQARCAAAVASAEPAMRGMEVRRTVNSAVIVGAVVAFVALVASPLATSALHVGYLVWGVAALWIAVTVVLQISLGAIQGLRLFVVVAALVAGPYGVFKVLTYVLVPSEMGELAWASGSLLVSSSLGLVVAVWVLRRHLIGARVRAKRGVQWRNAVRDSAVAALVWTTIGVVTGADVVVARLVMDPVEAGAYAAAGLFGKLAFHVPAALALVVVPTAASCSVAQLDAMRRRVSLVTVVVGVLTVCGLWLIGSDVIALVLGETYRDADASMPWIAAFSMMSALLLVHASIALGRGDVRHVLGWSALTMVTPIMAALFGDHPLPMAITMTAVVALAVVVAECGAGSLTMAWKRLAR